MPEIFTLSKRKFNPYLFFLLLVVLIYLPSSVGRQPFPPDEVRNVKIVHNMKHWHDYLILKYNDEDYFHKPPFYYWLLKLLSKIKGVKLLTLGVILNIFLSWGIISLNYLFLKKEGFVKTGFFAGMFLSTTSLFYGMNIILRMDILFLFFITLSIVSFWFSLRANKNYFMFLSAFSSFLATFSKGALGVILPLEVIISEVIFLKKKANLKKLFYWLAAVSVLIFLWMSAFSQISPGYFKKMLFRQTLERAFSSFTHKEPWYYYLIYILPIAFPWVFFEIVYFFKIKQKAITSWERINIFWFISGFLTLSLIGSKVVMYLVILLPPLCNLGARQFVLNREAKGIFLITAALLLIVSTAAFVVFKIKGEFLPGVSLYIIFFFALFLLVLFKVKPKFSFVVFFLFWVILLEIINFAVLPLISQHHYNKLSLSSLSRNYHHEKN